MSRPRRLLCGIFLLGVLLALCVAMYPQWLRAMAHWLDVGTHPQRAEYVMVLNGGEDTRPFMAAALVKAGFARHVLIVRTPPTPVAEDEILPPTYEINRCVLLNRGVPASNITILPGAATTTFDEAMALAAFLADKPKTRVLVVTNEYHSRRSRWVFARTLADRADQVRFISAPSDQIPMDYWWRDEEGSVTIIPEYLKLIFYVVRYGYLGYWLVACGALLLVAHWIRRRESASPLAAT